MRLLLHGLAGTGALWRGHGVAPDLAGHGHAPRLDSYPYAAVADELVARVGDELRAGGPIDVVGHSFGGVVALELAADRHGLDVGRVVALGMRTVWTAEDLAGMARIAGRGVRWFDDEAGAREWFVRVAGLSGVLAPDDPVVASGVGEEDGRWCLLADPEIYRVDAVDLPVLLAGVSCPVLLARGEHDDMAPIADLERFGLDVVTLPGVGHNAHVEDPAAVLALLD